MTASGASRCAQVARTLLFGGALTHALEAYFVARDTRPDYGLGMQGAIAAVRVSSWLALAGWTAVATLRALELSWSVGAWWVAGMSWLVPVVNLVAPFVLIRRLGLSRATPVIVTWAVVFSVGFVAAVLEFAVAAALTVAPSRGLPTTRIESLEWLLAAVSFVAATAMMVFEAFGVVVVGAVDRSQRRAAWTAANEGVDSSGAAAS